MEDSKQISKWIRSIAIAVIALMIACMAAVIVIDPFFQYHKPLSWFPYKVDNQLSNNAGMAKTFDYDSILTGSSMVSNFDLDSIKNKTGSQTVKVNYNGAYPKDIANILDYVFKEHENLETVYFGMDVYSYNSGPLEVKYPFPSHLYDDNIINDVSYLFNKDVLVQYIVEPLRFPSQKTDLSKVYMMKYDESAYSKEEVLKNYELPEKGILSEDEKKDKLEALDVNLKENLIPYIEGHPETRFVIFYPPYSILYWNSRDYEGWKDFLVEEYRVTSKALLEYSNVDIYCFSDAWEYVTDLDNYVDYIHQHARVNEYILDCFVSGQHKVTKENVDSVMDSLLGYINDYDYEKIFMRDESKKDKETN